MEITESKLKKHDIDADILRIIAAFGVIMIHVTTANTNTEIFFDALCRVSVPIFVMLSGFYMLSYKVTYFKLVKKCIDLLIKMFGWSAIYFLAETFLENRAYVSIRDTAAYLLAQPGHLWYIYTAVTLYIFTPIFYVFCEHAAKRDYQYALGVTFFFGTIVTIMLRAELFTTIEVIVDRMKVPYLLGFVFLYLLGGYYQRYGIGGKRERWSIYILGMIGVVITFAGTLLIRNTNLPGELLISFFSPFVVLASISLFVFVKSIYNVHPVKSKRVCTVITEISKCTLGVYLVHMLLLKIEIPMLEAFCEMIPVALAVIMKAFICLAVSVMIVLVMKRIPGLKKLVI